MSPKSLFSFVNQDINAFFSDFIVIIVIIYFSHRYVPVYISHDYEYLLLFNHVINFFYMSKLFPFTAGSIKHISVSLKILYSSSQ